MPADTGTGISPPKKKVVYRLVLDAQRLGLHSGQG